VTGVTDDMDGVLSRFLPILKFDPTTAGSQGPKPIDGVIDLSAVDRLEHDNLLEPFSRG